LYEIASGPACRSILPEVSIEVLDLPKASAIDYIVDAGNEYKVWYRNKMIGRWNLRLNQTVQATAAIGHTPPR
jgi:tetrahydromethanopterin S-methyltransferase subunit F